MLRRVRHGRHSRRKARPNAPLVRIGAQAKQERRIFAPQPLQDLARCAGVRPRLGVRRRDLAAVGEGCLARRPRLPVDDGDLVPVLGEIPRRGDADHARAENQDAHRYAGVGRGRARPRPPRSHFRVVLHRDAAAEEVAVAVDVVDARDRAASISRRAATRPDTPPPRADTHDVQSSRAIGFRGVRRMLQADCRRDRTGLPRRRGFPRGWRSSPSTNRSSSAFDSLSVGSTISVPATGKLIVGAWKP